MSQENVELLGGAFESFLAGKSDFSVELLDPEIEWDSSELTVPDIAGVYRGQRAFGSSGENGSPPGKPSNSSTS